MNADESWSKQGITDMLSHVDILIRGVKPIVDGAEQAVKTREDKILKENANVREGLETYVNCLRTAYKYRSGENALNEIANHLSNENDPRFKDTVTCCRQEALEYRSKTMAFPLDKCWENMPEVPHEGIRLFIFYILHEMNNIFINSYDDDDIFPHVTISSS
uniref:Uncharacterized protein n=1 Tax=Trichobilharzia regenti TaxID=157069 RepID=A0AA85JBJ9_TRIRE|nr:unnamed protein product [Trichobilharzia regenti]